MKLTNAELDVITERRRCSDVEGWTPDGDDLYVDGELVAAAACYALHGSGWLTKWIASTEVMWPWAWSWWKPTDQRRNLVKAANLLIAEIERLDRRAARVEQ